jgi:hypothetical protein
MRPLDILVLMLTAPCRDSTRIDPFSRKAVLQFFQPKNYHEGRKALEEAAAPS